MANFPVETGTIKPAPTTMPMDPMSRGTFFKALGSATLVLEAGEVKTLNPMALFCVACGPAGKTSVFLRRASGTAEGVVSIYGAFQEKPDNNAKVLLADAIAWTDDLTEIISNVANPFPFFIIEYNFSGNDDTVVELHFSFF